MSVYSVCTEMSDITAMTADTLRQEGPPPVGPLRIVIPGGEGHLGKILARYLAQRGHEITTLTRNPDGLSACDTRTQLADETSPRKVLAWDGCSLGSWTEALERADVLINLAGRSVDCRYNRRNREQILQSRLQSTAILGEAIRKMRRPPKVWLNASTATIYRHSFDRAMDESTGELGGDELDAPASWRFSIEVAKQWEHALFASSTPDTRKIALRTAMVMSSEPGGIFEVLSRLVQMGFGGAWGSGRQYISWIHEQDFSRGIEHLISHGSLTGAINLAAPVPLPNRNFMSALRRAWGIDVGLPASRWMLEAGAVVLRTETELLLKSRRVIPGILAASDFKFLFPAWPQAATDLVRSRRQRSRIR